MVTGCVQVALPQSSGLNPIKDVKKPPGPPRLEGLEEPPPPIFDCASRETGSSNREMILNPIDINFASGPANNNLQTIREYNRIENNQTRRDRAGSCAVQCAHCSC